MLSAWDKKLPFAILILKELRVQVMSYRIYLVYLMSQIYLVILLEILKVSFNRY